MAIAGAPSVYAPFEVLATDGRARRGRLTLPHAVVDTPVFMPVGTQGAVKALTHQQVAEAGARIILGNTYHLHLRPGEALIARLGGLHRFINWSAALLTDSGGYQVFSLEGRRRVTEAGVHFKSHLDGSARFLSPESAVDIQAALGSDIAMAFDECLAYPADRESVAASVSLTARWAARARARMLALRAGAESQGPDGSPLAPVPLVTPGQAQFGIVQGGVFPEERQRSAALTREVAFDAYAIGGLSVGEPIPLMYDIVEQTTAWLPADRPRYLMGVGTPIDLVEAVGRGVDMFDCVLPTRNARNGQLFTADGRINIKNVRYADDQRPIDDHCRCVTCRTASRAYLRHLFVSGEMTAAILNTLHNIQFYLDTMEAIREAIHFGRFASFRQGFVERYERAAAGG
jgi:queuine tRNA-ribosyltransferase